MQQRSLEQIMEFEENFNSGFYDEESNLNVFYQQKMGLFKKQSFFPEDGDYGFKNIVDCSTAEQTEDSEHSEITSEHVDSPTFPSKEMPAPQNADEYIYNLRMRYYPNLNQENFLLNYLNHDDIQRIKIGVDYDLLNDPETLRFENWIKGLCNTKAIQKEKLRKQKVKKYLEKKRNRTFGKKVHYQIRQKVAEERLRVKGRFVTWKQAVKMLEMGDTKREWTQNDYFKIKILLTQKYGDLNN